MDFTRKGLSRFSLWYVAGAIVLTIGVNSLLVFGSSETPVDFSAFRALIQSGEIKRIEMTSVFHLGYTLTQARSLESGAEAARVYRTTPVNDPNFVSLLDAKGVQYYAVLPVQRPLLSVLLSRVVPVALMFLVWRMLSRRMAPWARTS